MFLATDVAQMVWDSDSDDGEMEGGSDVEIELAVNVIASASTELDYDRSMYIDSIMCVIFTLMLYTVVDIIWMYDIFQPCSDLYE